ncbi:MAG: dTDP-glucose 4,6-dehydratase [Deltaproteobacteria bacterium]|nr:dTDP-glucose 4,6-dehydratase [Deltaproteobacteria bacterium]
MRNLLITGGAGFIGANFVYYWLQNHPEDRVVVLDALTYAGNLANLTDANTSPNYRFVHGDINDFELVVNLMKNERINTVVHFAAESHVDRSIHGPDIFIDTNVNGTHTLLKAAQSAWLDSEKKEQHRFQHVSTDEVYGSLAPDDPAFTETTPYAPNSPYSASKAASDHLVRAYHETFGLDTTISNCSNNYGPYQFPEKLIPLVIKNILNGENVPVYGDGLNIRDWLYVEDHCRAIELILLKGISGEVYNIGGNNELRNIDLVKQLCDLMDEKFVQSEDLAKRFPKAPPAMGKKSNSLITFVEDRLGHDRRYAIDSSKANKKLDYTPNESFETGILKTIDWYLNNQDWWKLVSENIHDNIA